jgi:translation elongation factor EF-Tu-like GTPase
LRLIALGDETPVKEAVTEALRQRGRVIIPWARADLSRCYFETASRAYDLYRGGYRRSTAELLRAHRGALDGALLIVGSEAGLSRALSEELGLARGADIPALVALLADAAGGDPARLDPLEISLRERLSASGFSGDDTPILRAAVAHLPLRYADAITPESYNRITHDIEAWRDAWTPALAPLLEALDAHLEPAAREP